MHQPRKNIKGSFVSLNKKREILKEFDPQKVNVFYERSPATKVTDIGLVEAFAEGTNVGHGDLLPELQKQAAKIGASGVYKIKIQRFNHSVEALHATGMAFE